MYICVTNSMGTHTIFMAHGGGRYVLNNFYPIMTAVGATAGICEVVDVFVIISINKSLQDGKEVMHGVIFAPFHRGPR